jgi:head-tail adaptor
MSDRRPLRSGDLRESILIEVSTEQANEYGEMTATWAPFARRRASIRGRRTDERVDSTSPHTVATYEVEFRYTPGLTTGMRIVWDNKSPPRILDIIGIVDLSRSEGHTVTCKEHPT